MGNGRPAGAPLSVPWGPSPRQPSGPTHPCPAPQAWPSLCPDGASSLLAWWGLLSITLHPARHLTQAQGPGVHLWPGRGVKQLRVVPALSPEPMPALQGRPTSLPTSSSPVLQCRWRGILWPAPHGALSPQPAPARPGWDQAGEPGCLRSPSSHEIKVPSAPQPLTVCASEPQGWGPLPCGPARDHRLTSGTAHGGFSGHHQGGGHGRRSWGRPDPALRSSPSLSALELRP